MSELPVGQNNPISGIYSPLADLNTALRGFKGDLHIHIEKSEKNRDLLERFVMYSWDCSK